MHIRGTRPSLRGRLAPNVGVSSPSIFAIRRCRRCDIACDTTRSLWKRGSSAWTSRLQNRMDHRRHMPCKTFYRDGNRPLLFVRRARARTRPHALRGVWAEALAPAARTATPPRRTSCASDPAAEAAQAAAEAKEKQPRLGEAAVYIDGKPVGVLRRQELPLEARRVTSSSSARATTTTRYSLIEYVTALGVDPKKVRAAHLYGGSRVVVVDRAELARIGTRDHVLLRAGRPRQAARRTSRR